MASKQSTKSDSPVAAEEALEARSAEDNTEERLQEQAKEQKKTQREELKSKARTTQDPDAEPAARRGNPRNTAVQGGFVDQMSRRSGNDALEGHYVLLDLNDKGVKDAFKAVGLEDHRGDYGVYLEPAGLNEETGRPEEIVVQLRDETHATVVVPYDAARPAPARGR